MRVLRFLRLASVPAALGLASLGCEPAAQPQKAGEAKPAAETTEQPNTTPAATETTSETPAATETNAAPESGAAAEPTTEETSMRGVTQASFGKTSKGDEVVEFTCVNANGLRMKLITYGAIMTAFESPDRDGKLANVNLSCEGMPGYEACSSYFGATVGRYCNRIAAGKFELDGQSYTLAVNNGPNHLPGGLVGFDKVIWKAEPISTDSAVGVAFTYTSPDGEEGYPGNLTVKATYTLDDKDALTIDFEATTDNKTVLNLTNHNYWNLAGEGSGDILGHELKLSCTKYLGVDAGLIPTGEMLDVAGTPFDFVDFHAIGERIQQTGGDPIGYDHCYVIEGQAGTLRPAAVVRDPKSGRTMEIHTTQPGIQFYSGNFMDGTPGSGGFAQHNAFCLETQHYPNSPNQPEFPTTVLEPGQTYKQTTVHKFSVTQ